LLATTGFGWLSLATVGVQQTQPNYAPIEISEELLWKTRLLLSINTQKSITSERFRRHPSCVGAFCPTGAYYISWYEGTRKRMERAGPDPIEAEKALLKKSAELSFLTAGGEIKANPADTHVRVKVSEAVEEYLSDWQGKSGYGLAARTVEAYQYRLGYLKSFRPEAYLDQIDATFIRQVRRFLIARPDDLGDRTCYNVMQAVSTFPKQTHHWRCEALLKRNVFSSEARDSIYTRDDKSSVRMFPICRRIGSRGN
jgi:hypothetical protein